MASSEKARVLLVGSGGVGTMAAFALEAGGLAEVTAVLRSNYETVQKQGFDIDSIEHGQGIKGFRPTHIVDKVPQAAQDGAVLPFDYILVTTKNIPDVRPTVLDLIEPAVTPSKTAIVLLQNGLNIEKPIVEHFPDNVVLSGVSFISASEKKGHVIHEFPDASKIGPFPSLRVSTDVAEAQARRFVHIYNACGKVDCQYDGDVAFTRWRKLVYNASFNSVSAVLQMGVITMRMTRHIVDDLIRPAMHEIIAIAKAAGVDLPAGIDDFFIRLDPPEDDFVPSMGQDAMKGNYMEVETIVGEPIREAQKMGVPVPVLQTIYALLKGLQVKTKRAKGEWKAVFDEDNPYR